MTNQTQTPRPVADRHECRYVPDKKICERYDITRVTLHRWRKNPRLGFPAPLVINGQNYNLEHELDAWDARNRAR